MIKGKKKAARAQVPKAQAWKSKTTKKSSRVTSKSKKVVGCSVCGKAGVNARTHPQHGG